MYHRFLTKTPSQQQVLQERARQRQKLKERNAKLATRQQLCSGLSVGIRCGIDLLLWNENPIPKGFIHHLKVMGSDNRVPNVCRGSEGLKRPKCQTSTIQHNLVVSCLGGSQKIQGKHDCRRGTDFSDSKFRQSTRSNLHIALENIFIRTTKTKHLFCAKAAFSTFSVRSRTS